jgi:hypothetical protein
MGEGAPRTGRCAGRDPQDGGPPAQLPDAAAPTSFDNGSRTAFAQIS